MHAGSSEGIEAGAGLALQHVRQRTVVGVHYHSTQPQHEGMGIGLLLRFQPRAAKRKGSAFACSSKRRAQGAGSDISSPLQARWWRRRCYSRAEAATAKLVTHNLKGAIRLFLGKKPENCWRWRSWLTLTLATATSHPLCLDGIGCQAATIRRGRVQGESEWWGRRLKSHKASPRYEQEGEGRRRR